MVLVNKNARHNKAVHRDAQPLALRAVLGAHGLQR